MVGFAGGCPTRIIRTERFTEAHLAEVNRLQEEVCVENVFSRTR